MAIMDKAGANKLTNKFLGAVADNGRLFALPKSFRPLLKRLPGVMARISAEVISAVTLDEKRQSC